MALWVAVAKPGVSQAPPTRTRPAPPKSLDDRLSLEVTRTPSPAGTHTSSEPRLVLRLPLTSDDPSRITKAAPRLVSTVRLATFAPERSMWMEPRLRLKLAEAGLAGRRGKGASPMSIVEFRSIGVFAGSWTCQLSLPLENDQPRLLFELTQIGRAHV